MKKTLRSSGTEQELFGPTTHCLAPEESTRMTSSKVRLETAGLWQRIILLLKSPAVSKIFSLTPRTGRVPMAFMVSTCTCSEYLELSSSMISSLFKTDTQLAPLGRFSLVSALTTHSGYLSLRRPLLNCTATTHTLVVEILRWLYKP
jgi:hypothetical protein